MPTDDEVFAQQRQMAVTRMLRPRAFSHTTYVDGAYGSFDPGEGEDGGLEELAFADFVNGVYRINGVTVTVDDMFTEDSENWSTFDPAIHITSGGLQTGDPVCTPALIALLLSEGYTAVGVFAALGPSPSPTGTFKISSCDFPDFASESNAKLSLARGGADATTTSVRALATPVTRTKEVEGLQDRGFAVTITGDRTSLSIDGGEVLTDTTAGPPAFNTVAIDLTAGIAVKHITFHPPQPDAALPALSVAP